MATLSTPVIQFFAARWFQLTTLAVLVLALLSSLIWQAMQFNRSLNSLTPLVVVTTSKTANVEVEDKPSPALLNLFGAEKRDNSMTAPVLEKLPESNLNLQVSAIFSMARPDLSSVILEDGDRTMILKQGEEARPGVVVQAIDSHRITLKRNGKMEQISFKGFGDMPGGNAIGNALPITDKTNDAPSINQNNVNVVTAHVPVTSSPGGPPPPDQYVPTAYQQYIQRKLAQTK